MEQVVANVAMLLTGLLQEFRDDEDDPSFRRHFRVTKPIFESLLEVVGNHLVDTGRLKREKRPLAHRLLMALWILATPDSFRSVALRFGVHKSELHNHYASIIKVMRELSHRYITWPTQEERNGIKDRCERLTQFPGIIGIMDGSHISILAPREDKASHRNYHHGHSIKVQAVADDRLLVRDIYIGEAGSLHDARVFRRSPLCRNILERNDMFGPGEHIIADSEYMLLDKVLIPFLNNGHLTDQLRNYNRRLSGVRARVEHSFGRAEILWRRLFYLPCQKMEYTVDHVAACFVLHNFNILHGEDIDVGHVNHNGEHENGEEDEEAVDDPFVVQGVDDIIPDPHVPHGNLQHELRVAQRRGEQKRWDVCNMLQI